MKLDRSKTALIIIDVQERLLPVIHEAAAVTKNIERLVRGCQVLGIPIFVSEQYVRGLGATVPELRRALDETPETRVFEKLTFSAVVLDSFSSALLQSGRSQLLVSGIETHVCVHQTVQDLLTQDFEVSVVADAVSSRTAENKDIALRRMISDGVTLTSTEMALFELLQIAGTEEFRAISALIK
jgi:nicotinamidase-related amidase